MGYVIVTKFGDRYKVVGVKGLPPTTGRKISFERREHGDDERFLQSLSRSRGRIFELAACNPWDYFCTLTISPEHYNRADLGTFRADLSQWIRNQNRLHSLDVKYLLVPEPHKASDGWHMHGFMMGFSPGSLEQLSAEMKLPLRLLQQIKKGDEVYRWPGYEKKFGWNTLMPIKDRHRAAGYVTKYITKDTGLFSLQSNAHLFYASKGLCGCERMFAGYATGEPEWQFENDYCLIRWMDEPSFTITESGSLIFREK